VQDFFELFVTVVVAVLFFRLGAVTVVTAKRVIYLDAILYLMGGILGTAHHWYFTGQSSVTMAIGVSFSAFEVVPLVYSRSMHGISFALVKAMSTQPASESRSHINGRFTF
jgi:nitric oxide reductase large subunit